jgi:DNA-binding HxlR family transcriptional regulator
MNSNSYEIQSPDLCPIAATIRKIGSEPKLVVVRYLSEEERGFNSLLKATGLSPKTLSSTLKALEREGIVTREVLSTRPFKVMYSLTEKGRDLGPVLEKMGEWGKRWLNRDDAAGINTPRGMSAGRAG